jgi:hypothetical protein
MWAWIGGLSTRCGGVSLNNKILAIGRFYMP